MRGIARTFCIAFVLLAAARVAASDCNKNGVEDWRDIEAGTSADCDTNGVPDECDVAPVNFGLTSQSAGLLPDTPFALAVADLDDDDLPDLFWAQQSGAGAGLAWNNGLGGFLAVALPPGERSNPSAVVSADLDGDGRPEIVTAGVADAVVFRNGGGRRFADPVVHATGVSSATALAAGDVDGDGDTDLVVAGDFRVQVLENVEVSPGGARSLSPRGPEPVGSDPVDAVLTDLDVDGSLDIATANRLGNVSVLWGRGDGDFETARNFIAGGSPSALRAVDLDGDGAPELAVLDAETGALFVFRNRGGRVFEPDASLAGRAGARRLATGDFDRDGDEDIAIGPVGGTVGLYLNQGDGRLTAMLPAGASAAAPVLLLATLPPDSTSPAPRLVATTTSSRQLRLYVEARVAYAVDCNGDRVPDSCQTAEADCNGNGIPDDCDVASRRSSDCDANGVPDECQADCNANGAPDSCDIRDGVEMDCNANGVPDQCDLRSGIAFDVRLVDVGAPFVLDTVPDDLDGDGDIDLAVLSGSGFLVVESADGVFRPRGEVSVVSNTAMLAHADFDGDGDTDFAVLSSEPTGAGLTLLENLGQLRFEARLRTGRFDRPTTFVAADADADRDVDVLVLDVALGEVVVLANDGGGTLSEAGRFRTGRRDAGKLAVADLDGDGLIDAVAAGPSEPAFAVLRGLPGGAFGAATVVPSEHEISAIAVDDLDADGDLDVAVASLNSLLVTVHLNDGNGELSERMSLDPVVQPSALLSADVGGDGRADLLVVGFGGVPFDAIAGQSPLVVIEQLGDGRFAPPVPVQFADAVAPIAFRAGDVDLDGDTDFVIAGFFACPFCVGADVAPIIAGGPTVTLLLNETSPPASADRDGDGVPDECQRVPFHRGDVDQSGGVALGDATAVLDYLFRSGERPACLEAADADGDRRVAITDAVYLLNFLFRSGPPPVAPGPPPAPCAEDDDDEPGCEFYAACP